MANRRFEGNIPYTDPAGIISFLKDPRYGESFIRKEYSRARSAMVKSIARIEASGRKSYASKPKILKELSSTREAAYELSKIYRFMYSKHGSLEGVKETERRFAETMKGKHIKFLKGGDIDTARTARAFMIYVASQKDRKSAGYEAVLRTYQKLEKGNTKGVSSRMQRLYNEFKEWGGI